MSRTKTSKLVEDHLAVQSLIRAYQVSGWEGIMSQRNKIQISKGGLKPRLNAVRLGYSWKYQYEQTQFSL